MGASAQPRVISGTLKTTDRNPVPNASITVRDMQDRVVAFKTSDSFGNFQIALPVDLPDSLRLLANHLGYAPIDVPLTPGQHHYDFVLTEKAIDLSEVNVKSHPRIDVQGDTLRYDIRSFTKAEDRSIGDVLRRMPGMEVSENGQIKYNGQNISHFYIDGDDLLNDKYAIGTKTIPHAMVQTLEVLQNHQPLKVLKGKALTDQVAINLVIKDDAKLKLTGQAKLGGGLPHQYDGELNAILFNKRYKMLNVLKGNNVGDDLSADGSPEGSRSQSPPLLSTGTASNPPLPRQRYYFNNSGAINANNLIHLKNGLQLKFNGSGLLDRNNLLYNSLNEQYTSNDTIRYTEQQDIRKQPSSSEVSITATVNEETHYFNNVFKFIYAGESGTASLVSNGINMSQQLHTEVHNFSNTMQYAPTLKSGGVIDLYWHVSRTNQPQALTIRPGIHADVLNDGEPFTRIRQFAEIPTWSNRATVGYQLTKGLIKQRYQAGVSNEWQQLRSALRLTQPLGTEQPYRGSDDNNVHWQQHQIFTIGTYEYKRGRLEASAELPITLQHTTYRDAAFALHKSKQHLLFTPSFRVKLMTTAADYLSFTYRYNNHIGNINSIFRGAILVNYRSIQTNDAQLQEQNDHTLGLRYNFQRPIHMLFMNAGITYNRSTASTIASSVVTDDITQTILLPFDNDIRSFTANIGISKFIFALGAAASLKGSWSSSSLNQLLNSETLPFLNRSLTVNPGIEARLFNRISINYNGSGTWTTSQLAENETVSPLARHRIRQINQSVGLTYIPFSQAYLHISGNHQHISQPFQANIAYFFADANIRYHVTGWRTDLELNLTNLANVTSYKTYSLSANQFGYTHYELRGRMILVKATFNL